jgi:hypothetical protein
MCFTYITYTAKHHVIVEHCHPREARFGRPQHILTAFSRDAEPHGFEAHGNVVRSVQGDCGLHAPGVAAVARQCGLD